LKTEKKNLHKKGKNLLAQKKRLKVETGFAVASNSSIMCMTPPKRQFKINLSSIGASLALWLS